MRPQMLFAFAVSLEISSRNRPRSSPLSLTRNFLVTMSRSLVGWPRQFNSQGSRRDATRHLSSRHHGQRARLEHLRPSDEGEDIPPLKPAPPTKDGSPIGSSTTPMGPSTRAPSRTRRSASSASCDAPAGGPIFSISAGRVGPESRKPAVDARRR